MGDSDDGSDEPAASTHTGTATQFICTTLFGLILNQSICTVMIFHQPQQSSLAQLAERKTVNLEAVSSILTGRVFFVIEKAPMLNNVFLSSVGRAQDC
jgi:hypothetical protein